MSRTVCNMCHVHCPLVAEVRNGRVVRLSPDREHPFGGLMCVKGKAAPELVDHPERVLFPLRRVGPKTDPSPRWARVSWDEALTDIASRLMYIREHYGPETIVFAKGTRSGTGLGDAERWLRRLANVLGSPNMVSTTHLCQWPRDEGTRYTFGVKMPWPDLDRSGCLLLWGCNPASTNIRLAHDIQEARARGMKLVTVDPRRVGMARQSDIHLMVDPGTDGALALGLAHVLVQTGTYDREFVRNWTNAPLLVRLDTGQLLKWRDVAGEAGPSEGLVAWAGGPVPYTPSTGSYGTSSTRLDLEGAPVVPLAGGGQVCTATVWRLLRDLLAQYPPERVAVQTGVPADQIRLAAEFLAMHRPVAHYFWNGLTQHTNAAQNGRALSVLYALLGDFDAPGGNVVVDHPRTNPVELGGLLGQDAVRRRLGWLDRPLGAPRTTGNSAGYDVYDSIMQEKPYRVRALLAFGTNMAMSSGDSLQGMEALRKLDLLVCTDFFITPTAQLADYVLPATTFLEAPTLIVGWDFPIAAVGHVQYRWPVVEPRGEARSDTQIIFDLAVSLGFGDKFWHGDVEAAYSYELEPLGITLEDLKRRPVGVSVTQRLPTGGGRRYSREAGGGGGAGFHTPTRKVELFASRFAEAGENPLPRYEPPVWSAERQPQTAREYPFILTNAKVSQFCHSQGRALPTLRRMRPHPQVELHPETASLAGVRDGCWVMVETPEGAVRAQAKVNPAIKPGVVVGQHGWWQACEGLGLPGYPPFSSDGANVNLLVSNRHRDPISGGTPFRSARCRLRPVELPLGC